jgi:hypothetical protein
MTGNLKPYFNGKGDVWREPYEMHYCSLCASLRKLHGLPASFLLNYDMTYMILGVTHYLEGKVGDTPCPSKYFMQKRIIKKHSVIDRAAELTMVLSWLKTIDIITDRKDVKSGKYLLALTASKWIDSKIKNILETIDLKTKEIIEDYLQIAKGDDKDFKRVKEATYNLAKHISLELLKEIPAPSVFKAFYSHFCGLSGQLAALFDPIIDLEEDLSKKMYNPIIFESRVRNKSIPIIYGEYCQMYFDTEDQLRQELKINEEHVNEYFYHHVQNTLRVNKRKITEVTKYVFNGVFDTLQ